MANTRARTKKSEKATSATSKASTPKGSTKSKAKQSTTKELKKGSETPNSVAPRIKVTFKGEVTQNASGKTISSSNKATKKGSKPLVNKNLFGVQDCPVFFPSEEQFSNPHQFIESILPILEKFGMCKVQPPTSWDPEFAPDLKEYKFKTQVQKLNLTGIKARLSSSFREKSRIFYEMTQLPLKTPIFYSKFVEMGRFKEYVEEKGGYDSVTVNKKWSQIGRALGYEPRDCTSLSYGLRNMYETNISPLKFYLELAECIIGSKESPKQTKTKVDPSIPPIEGFYCKLCRIKDPPKKDRVFATMDSEAVIGKLNCSSCSSIYHKKCFSKLLGLLPQNEFYCPECIYNFTPVFGFDYGAEYKLPEFMLKAERFKKQYYKDKTFPEKLTRAQEEDWIEKHYWGQLDESATEISVESGAEISAAFHGSGFPSRETNSTSIYSGHPWNFIKLTNDPNNLLSHLRNKNTGLDVPWIYVGMMFSTFCWHSEDHNTFTLNYHHWGDPKTYYSIPASHSHKLMETFKEIAPQVLESEPDLLSQLITMISPEDLVNRGIPVYKSTQRHGQFIITMPQVYHCNFSHGFNFTESINYAPYSWLPFGQKAIDEYKILKQEPLFSHQELVLNSAEAVVDKSQAFLLIPLLEQVKREIEASCDSCRKQNKSFKYEPRSKSINPDEIPCCFECKTICFLMSVACTKCSPKKVSCVEHIKELCNCPMSSKKVLVHVEASEIELHIEKLTKLTYTNDVWLNSYKSLIAEHRYPNVEGISKVLSLAKELKVVREEAENLNDFYNQCLKWNGQADRFLYKRAIPGSDEFSRFNTAKDLNLAVATLLKDFEKLSFSSTSGASFKAYVEYIIKVRNLMESYKKQGLDNSTNFNALFSTIQDSAVSKEEIKAFKDASLENFFTAILALEKGTYPMTLATACGILEKMGLLGVKNDNTHYKKLNNLIAAGNRWTEQVNPVLNDNGDYQVSYLQQLIDQASNIPHDPEIVTLLQLRKSHTDLPRSRKPSLCQDPVQLERAMSAPRRNTNTIANVEVWLATCKHVLFINVPDKSQTLKGRLEYLISCVFRMIDDPVVDLCICMTTQSYRQITCSKCAVSYHKTCLGPRKNFLNKDPYLCPMCDPNSKGPIVKKRPTLLGLERLLADGAPFASDLDVYKLLSTLVSKLKDFAQSLMSMVKESTIPVPVDGLWSKKLSYNLRILHGMEIYLAPQTKELTKVLHMQPKKDEVEQPTSFVRTSLPEAPASAYPVPKSDRDTPTPEEPSSQTIPRSFPQVKRKENSEVSCPRQERESSQSNELPLPSEFSPKRFRLDNIQLSYSLEASLAQSDPISVQPGPIGSSHSNHFHRKLSHHNQLYDGAEFAIRKVLLQESDLAPVGDANWKEDSDPFSIASLLGRPITPPPAQRPILKEPKATVLNPNYNLLQHQE